MYVRSVQQKFIISTKFAMTEKVIFVWRRHSKASTMCVIDLGMEFMCLSCCLKLSPYVFFFIFELFTMLSLAKYAKCFHIATSMRMTARMIGFV